MIKKSKKQKMKASEKEASKVKIGEHLVKVGAVKPEDVETALDEQQITGGRVGKILQAKGKISAYRFYQEYSKYKNLEFVNLDEQQYEKNLIDKKSKDKYFNYQYIPFKKEDDVICIATTEEVPDIFKHLDEEYGEGNYKIFITSPFDILWTLQNHFSDHDTDNARNLLHKNNPGISSKDLVFSTQGKIILALIVALVCSMLMQKEFFITSLLILNMFYFFTMISKILFFVVGILFKKEINVRNSSYEDLSNEELPTYSVLVPLYKEKKKTIKKLLQSLKDMDYPSSKLDIKLICENDDFETVEIIKSLKPESYFQIIRVPYSEPRTKPKACNYALSYCTGEYVTIYDAEDIPDPQQLRKTAAIFMAPESKVSCIQARLNYFNRNENLLSGMFSIEYSSWFDFMLYGLKKMNLPIPLGGTSNHFKTSKLRALYAWDPYNVTEDADLGIRISFTSLETEVLDSLTQEESPVNIRSWMAQRSRWIKGYIQTFFVHMRNPIEIYRKLGALKLLGFTFFVGAPFVVFLTVPLVVLSIIINFIVGNELPGWLYVILQVNLYLGIILHFFISFFVIAKNSWYENVISAFCFPFYWVLHYVASFKAVYELLKRPHHWNKTEHGLSIYTNTA